MTVTESTCGQALIRLLEQRGVEIVFGIPGVHTLELYRGLADSSIRHVTPRHEQGAAFMADGYARISRRPGVCLLITGAGVTNAATAIASAYHDSQPLLIISSATATRHARKGHGSLHDLPDQQKLMAAITASSETVLSPADLPAALDRAFAHMGGHRPRPVHIGIPIDVLAAPYPAEGGDLPGTVSPGATDIPAEDLAQAARLLAEARRPMILLGGGAIDAGEEALRISAACGAPIVTTVNGKGAVPETHPAALGVTTSLEPVYGALQAADAVLAVGTEFSELDYYYQPDIPAFEGALIRIDRDRRQLRSQREPALGLAGDATEVLAELAARVEPLGPDRSEEAATRAGELRAGLRWWPGASDYFGVLDALAAALPQDAIVATDSTQPAYVANSYLRVAGPRSWLCPAGFGTLGPALPMAIGAKLAQPGRPVVCLVGDAGLLFTVAELATAADLGLPIAVLVWQNHGYGEIREAMDQARVPHIGTEAGAHDYMELAKGFGCHGVRVSSLAELDGAMLSAFSAEAPTVIELDASALAP
ncbi:MAG TPA: 5-guanidino-2-oxopentanoate decarboxylase [Solirubrobacteraceae bacterium]|nr:5-guanidino-2-oxopentanoate decarboxylase [Solirubrobacteraceae bacterium]